MGVVTNALVSRLLSRRGVGFDKPQSEGKHISTCGCVSMKSFGHSGYTGTYAWADPEKELLIVILANMKMINLDKEAYLVLLV